MIYGISIITTNGFPYFNKDYAIEPKNKNLKILFFNYSKKLIQSCQENEFELVAGLISALFNFSGAQNRPIDELIYKRPEFQIENLLDGQQPDQLTTGTLVTVRCDYFSIKAAVKQKLDYIYDKIIKQLEPLNEKKILAPSEQKLIQDVLLNMPSKQLIRANSKKLDNYLKSFLKETSNYGIKAIAIASSDLTILKTVNITRDELENLLNIVDCPQVEPLNWKFRQVWDENNQQLNLVFINSAYAVEYDTLKETLMYIIICDAYSAIAELPRKLLLEINETLG